MKDQARDQYESGRRMESEIKAQTDHPMSL